MKVLFVFVFFVERLLAKKAAHKMFGVIYYRTDCRPEYLDEITEKCEKDSSIVDIFKFIGDNLKSEIDHNDFVLGGSVSSILPLLQNCTSGVNFTSIYKQLFHSEMLCQLYFIIQFHFLIKRKLEKTAYKVLVK